MDGEYDSKFPSVFEKRIKALTESEAEKRKKRRSAKTSLSFKSVYIKFGETLKAKRIIFRR